ncbi:hypothetical protein COO20_00165 [Thalassospira marina]|uniref:Uncharacterized protein n=1 Tax=Thalassospira marina TaxID=2048283 RepID=A0A2N3KYM7_9PROT|nr:hypothetical protein COO20_00165 [Thalassospira marina]
MRKTFVLRETFPVSFGVQARCAPTNLLSSRAGIFCRDHVCRDPIAAGGVVVNTITALLPYMVMGAKGAVNKALWVFCR